MTPFVVIEDSSASFGFGFETTIFRKALVCCIVITVSFRTHALGQSIESHELSKLLAGVVARRDQNERSGNGRVASLPWPLPGHW